MPEHSSNVAIWVAVIAALGTMIAALETGIFGLAQTRINVLPPVQKTDSGSPKPYPEPAPSIVGRKSEAGTKTSNVSISSTRSQPHRDLWVNEPPSINKMRRSAVCDADSDHLPIRLVIPIMPGADLYADDQLCRKNVGDSENLEINLAKGDHDLTLKRGDRSCSAHIVLPSKDQSVIITCQ